MESVIASPILPVTSVPYVTYVTGRRMQTVEVATLVPRRTLTPLGSSHLCSSIVALDAGATRLTSALTCPKRYTPCCVCLCLNVEVAMSRTRTNIELDDDAIETAMRLYGTRSKKETVDLALRRLIGSSLDTEQALALEGSGWQGDLDQMRDDSPPDAA